MMNGVISNLNVLPLELPAAKIFGELKAELRKQGELIADMDLLIASSIALSQKHILVTNNTKHFSRIKGLSLENWNE